jgi:hypothetical protein
MIARMLAHQDRLQHALRLDRGDEFVELALVEIAARLIGAGDDVRHRNSTNPARRRGDAGDGAVCHGCRVRFHVAEQCRKSATQFFGCSFKAATPSS